MSVILSIGNYKIDSAETGSESTTAGVRLLLPEGPRVRWVERSTSFEVTFLAQVTGTPGAELTSRINALRDAVVLRANQDLVVTSEGAEVASWKISTHQFSRIVGDFEPDVAEDGALCGLVFRAERLDVSPGEPAGALGPVVWEFGQDGNGQPTASGRATFDTRDSARTWIAGLRAGTGKPGWMGSRLRFATPHYGMDQTPGSVAATEDSYTPCVVTAIFNSISAPFAANPAFDDVVYVDVDSDMIAGGRLDRDAGAVPPRRVVIRGTIQFKTDTAQDFDSGDTETTDAGEIRTKALACIDAIEEDAKTRHDGDWRRIDDPPDLTISASRGVVHFTLNCLATQGDILAWEEELKITRTTRDGRVPGGKGVRNHRHRLGPELRCTHRISIEALTVQEYPMPAFLQSSRWAEDSFTPGKPSFGNHEGGFETVVQTFEGMWTLLSDGNEQDSGATSFDALAGAS